MGKTKESVRFYSNSGTFELDVLEASQSNHVRNYPFSSFNTYEGGSRLPNRNLEKPNRIHVKNV